ncbi:hypothetical protein FGG08_004228 [Glutinoglossum americanum]|uniref:Transcription factor CBF/NF-Y/archaeal histone domain-containing protein n=1 Tax=Glutinoglossum americanum TaxID=1670608 RepID=A0A9P8I5J8_9PEZI|nr:hypothetical protein FGG08_004228 [Glutinoglossum americanum]
MPYNNTAIPPPDEVTGQAALPLARVKRIIHLDEDVVTCSTNAAFVVTVATEMFVQYLAEQGHNVVKSERKPRRNIQYKDLGMDSPTRTYPSQELICPVRQANAVSRIDNLEFLSDVIPRTIPYKQYKEKKSKEAANGDAVETGQPTLKKTSNQDAVNGTLGSNDERGEGGDGQEEMELEIRSSRTNGSLIGGGQTNGKHTDDVSMG